MAFPVLALLLATLVSDTCVGSPFGQTLGSVPLPPPCAFEIGQRLRAGAPGSQPGQLAIALPSRIHPASQGAGPLPLPRLAARSFCPLALGLCRLFSSVPGLSSPEQPSFPKPRGSFAGWGCPGGMGLSSNCGCGILEGGVQPVSSQRPLLPVEGLCHLGPPGILHLLHPPGCAAVAELESVLYSMLNRISNHALHRESSVTPECVVSPQVTLGATSRKDMPVTSLQFCTMASLVGLEVLCSLAL